ncbi:MAG TPA: NAD(P)/FAD-dependent oxidoreductase, partial [Rhabdaerophilum sp.]|nr:NAD(P)/FAD-dependent oxidoreductase [Rhabdaerophilum sp.]
VALVTEAMILADKPVPKDDPAALAALVKALPLRVTGTAGLDRAISTAGGIRFDALDEHFMLKALPSVFAAGEMLDWEAPTGGYLLQASFATGVAAAKGMIQFLNRKR